MVQSTKKFKLPRGEDKTKHELTPSRDWVGLTLLGGSLFFLVFLGAYFFFLHLASLEEVVAGETSAEVVRVVDQGSIHTVIDWLEGKEMRLKSLATTTPSIVDPSR